MYNRKLLSHHGFMISNEKLGLGERIPG